MPKKVAKPTKQKIIVKSQKKAIVKKPEPQKKVTEKPKATARKIVVKKSQFGKKKKGKN